jgi:hypothetical protein
LIMYLIYDENKELMRTVARQEEAKQIVESREGWTFKCVRKIVRKIVEGYKFEEALF